MLHDRPVVWACQKRNWPADLPLRHLPSQSTMSRRLQSGGVQRLFKAIEAQLRSEQDDGWILRIDSKPLPVGSHSKDADARWGKAGKSFARGYKLHVIWGAGPLPVAWRIEPMNTGDAPAARKLLENVTGGGYLVGDKQYDSNPLHAQAAAAGFQVVAQQKRAGDLGHTKHEAARLHALEMTGRSFGRALLRYRDNIERDFGRLTCVGGGLGPLPAWVRTLPRVTLWVAAKLLAHALRCQQPTQAMTAVA